MEGMENSNLVTYMKDEKNEIHECVICDFKDNQESIIETQWGYAHQECLDDSEAEANIQRRDPNALMDEEVDAIIH